MGLKADTRGTGPELLAPHWLGPSRSAPTSKSCYAASYGVALMASRPARRCMLTCPHTLKHCVSS